MPSVYIVEQGATVGKESRRLIVRKQGEVLQVIPLIHVDRVLVFGNVQVTTQAIHLLLADDIDLVYLSYDGRYCGRLCSAESKRADVRLVQYARASDRAWCLRLAQRSGVWGAVWGSGGAAAAGGHDAPCQVGVGLPLALKLRCTPIRHSAGMIRNRRLK